MPWKEVAYLLDRAMVLRRKLQPAEGFDCLHVRRVVANNFTEIMDEEP